MSRRGTVLDLDGLVTKYERLVVLRESHVRARDEPGYAEPDPRAAMVGLARAWPGCLRELDTMPLDEMRARLAALVAVRAGHVRAARWMIAQDCFHRHARGALAAKLWLGKRRVVDDATRASFRALAPAEAQPWESALAEIAAPPRGRLMDLVHARVAQEMGASEDESRRLVHAALSELG